MLEWMRCTVGRRADRDHGAADRPEAHGHAPRDLRDATTSRRRPSPRPTTTSSRSGPRTRARRAAVPVEREDALRQDVRHLPARKKLGAKRVLVVTFKPAVEDAWQTDLESHVDFDGWQYLSRHCRRRSRSKVDRDTPLVYFGSFQDLLGRDQAGQHQAKNEWLHTINWDLVIFDEYHFGAWRDTAKELFEGEDVDGRQEGS